MKAKKVPNPVNVKAFIKKNFSKFTFANKGVKNK